MTDPVDAKTEETRLTAARDEALELAKARPTGANLKALKKAEAALNEYRDSLGDTAGEVFPTIIDMVAWLDAEGWKISKSSAYEHRDEGKIRPGADGKFSRAAVLEYARKHLQRKDGGTDEKSSLQEQRLLEEIRRISSDANLRELKYRERQGELMPREHVEVELASRASDLRTHLDASARASATRIIKLVAGDIQKAPELIGFMLGINRKVLDNYSRPIQGIEEEEG